MASFNGPNENKLRAITAETDWAIDELAALRTSISQLEIVARKLVSVLGWEGESARNAQEAFLMLRRSLVEKQDAADRIDRLIRDANAARNTAEDEMLRARKPTVPWPIQLLAQGMENVDLPFPPHWTVPATEVVARYEAHIRNEKAGESLERLEAALVGPTTEMQSIQERHFPLPSHGARNHDDDDDDGSGGGGGGGGGGRTGGWGWQPQDNPHVYRTPTTFTPTPIGDPGPPPGPPITGGPVPPSLPVPTPVTPSTVSIDGDTSTATAGYGGGAGGAGGGLVAGSRGLGSGAVLGGTLGGGAGAAGTGGLGVAAIAGARGGGASMMGGGGGAGGGSEKEKRSGLGLIAPKLEDDEDAAPRSSSAGAGGRD